MNGLYHKINQLKERFSQQFASSYWHGLCIQVGRGEETKIKDIDSDAREVFPDDAYSLYAYFRLIDEESFTVAYGEGDGTAHNIQAPLVLIVHTSDIFNSDKLVRFLEGYDNIAIVSRNMDGNSLFSREFGNSEKKWDYEKFYLFEIRFNLIYTIC